MPTFNLAGADAATVAALHAYGVSWWATALAAVPADRPTAEAAVAELYKRANLAAPRFAWVASPAAVAVADQALGPASSGGSRMTSHRRTRIDPNRLRPGMAWSAEVRRWLGDEPADDPRWHRPRRPMADLLGFDVLRSGLGVTTGSGSLARLRDPGHAPDPRSGAMAIGDAEWTSVTASISSSLVEQLLRQIGREVCAGVREVADSRSLSLAKGHPWMMGQFDYVSPYLAVAQEVLGRRSTPESRNHISPFLALARSSGPWVALDGLAILSERPTSRLDYNGALYQLTYRDGSELVGAVRGIA